MKGDKFQTYSEKCVHFIDFFIPKMLENLSQDLNELFSITS